MDISDDHLTDADLDEHLFSRKPVFEDDENNRELYWDLVGGESAATNRSISLSIQLGDHVVGRVQLSLGAVADALRDFGIDHHKAGDYVVQLATKLVHERLADRWLRLSLRDEQIDDVIGHDVHAVCKLLSQWWSPHGGIRMLVLPSVQHRIRMAASTKESRAAIRKSFTKALRMWHGKGGAPKKQIDARDVDKAARFAATVQAAARNAKAQHRGKPADVESAIRNDVLNVFLFARKGNASLAKKLAPLPPREIAKVVSGLKFGIAKNRISPSKTTEPTI